MKFDLKCIIKNTPRVTVGLVFAFSGIGKLINREDAVNLVERVSDLTNIPVGRENEIVLVTILIELILAFLLFAKKKLFLTYILSFFSLEYLRE